MRILILTWRDLAHSAAGGAEVYTEQVARRWTDAGHEVTLFAATVPRCRVSSISVNPGGMSKAAAIAFKTAPHPAPTGGRVASTPVSPVTFADGRSRTATDATTSQSTAR